MTLPESLWEHKCIGVATGDDNILLGRDVCPYCGAKAENYRPKGHRLEKDKSL